MLATSRALAFQPLNPERQTLLTLSKQRSRLHPLLRAWSVEEPALGSRLSWFQDAPMNDNGEEIAHSIGGGKMPLKVYCW